MENFTVSRGKWREYDVKVKEHIKAISYSRYVGIFPPMTRLEIWTRNVTRSNRSKITAATKSLKMMTGIIGLKLY